ncbi:MAG: biotin-dependent carboxyltransferase family protein [Dokdonella sp.]
MSVHVLAPGLLTSVQAGPRSGYRHLGVGASGALDPYSFTVANLLVGNDPEHAVLEMTLKGPRVRFEQATRIAICGATIDAFVGDIAIPGWRYVDLPAASELSFGHCRNGVRAYLAIAGGFDVDVRLGNASTDLRAGFGGWQGRALASGDVLPVGSATMTREYLHIDSRWIDSVPDLDFSVPALIRLLPGHDAVADPNSLYGGEWKVDAASNRQGLRLQGLTLRLRETKELDANSRISEPVMPGTVQLPPDGKPIVLLADAQSHGGYPRIGHCIAVDRPRLAQLRTGDVVRFAPCTHEDARRLAREQRQRLARIAIATGPR